MDNSVSLFTSDCYTEFNKTFNLLLIVVKYVENADDSWHCKTVCHLGVPNSRFCQSCPSFCSSCLLLTTCWFLFLLFPWIASTHVSWQDSTIFFLAIYPHPFTQNTQTILILSFPLFSSLILTFFCTQTYVTPAHKRNKTLVSVQQYRLKNECLKGIKFR
jgi:hypothetical protein